MYFVKCKLINKSGKIWDSTYFSYIDDIDIGSGTAGSRDDAVGCDTARNLGFIYNADNLDATYGSNPPALGYSLLQSPLVHTGNNNDTAKLPYDTLIGYKLIGMTGFNHFVGGYDPPCFGEPNNAFEAYNFMRGLDGCGREKIHPHTGQPTTFSLSGDACNRIGWFDSLSHDVRFLMNAGPFTMNSLDTQVIVLAAIVGRGTNNFQSVCRVQAFTDSALKYYYNDFPCVPIGIQNISSEIPGEFKLYQNYPNPFNPATKIRFDISVTPQSPLEGGKRGVKDGLGVRLVIYDLLGRETSVLVNDKLQPGKYEIAWDGTNYPSGIYFFILTSGDFTETRKMVLLK